MSLVPRLITEGIINNFTMSSYRGGEWSFINLGSRELFRGYVRLAVYVFFRVFFSHSSLGVSILHKTEKFSERLSLTFKRLTHLDHAARK